MNNNTITIPTENHQQMKQRHSDEFGKLDGIFWAFSNEQLEEGLKKVNARKEEIYSIGAGGYVRKDKANELKELLERQERERKELRKDNKLLFDALVYELWNHEYCVTYDYNDALNALGITKEDVGVDMLKKACRKALAK